MHNTGATTMIVRKVEKCTGADLQEIAFNNVPRIYGHVFIIAKRVRDKMIVSFSGCKRVPKNLRKTRFEYAILAQYNDSDFPYVGKVRTKEGSHIYFLCEHDAYEVHDSLKQLLSHYPSIDVFKVLEALRLSIVVALIDEERCEVFGPKFEDDIKGKNSVPWYASVYHPE